jgi:hypothetical protein
MAGNGEGMNAAMNTWVSSTVKGRGKNELRQITPAIVPYSPLDPTQKKDKNKHDGEINFCYDTKIPLLSLIGNRPRYKLLC